MYGLIEHALFTAFLAAFFILFITRVGWREDIQTHAPKFMSEAVGCGFCLSFWACLCVTLFLAIFERGGAYIWFAPFLATPLTRVLT